MRYMEIFLEKNDNKYILVYVTTDSEEEAISLSKIILSEKLAACSNIFNESLSLFWWNNKINEAKEFVILFKTTSLNEGKLINRLLDLHSYENPCVVSVPILSGSPKFLEWVSQQTNLL